MEAVDKIKSPAAEEAIDALDATPKLSVTGVVSGAVAAIWPHVLPMIEAARAAVPDMISMREWPEDIKAKAESGIYQIWLIYDGSDLAAVAVSSVEQYARVKACVVQYTAGRGVDEWLGVWIHEIREWAIENNCDQIECRGRHGWGKKLKPFGAEIAGCAYVMGVE